MDTREQAKQLVKAALKVLSRGFDLSDEAKKWLTKHRSNRPSELKEGDKVKLTWMEGKPNKGKILESTSKSVVVLIKEGNELEEYQYEFYKEGFYMEVNNFGEILTIKKIS